MATCEVCGFKLADRATKCLFCGHQVEAAAPSQPSGDPPAAGVDPATADPSDAAHIRVTPSRAGPRPPPPSPANPRSTPNRPPTSHPSSTPPAPPMPLIPPGPVLDARSGPSIAAAPVGAPTATPTAASKPAMILGAPVTTILIAALLGAIAGGVGFMIFIALRG